MARSTTEAFMRTLQQTEQSGDVEPLVRLFGEDAQLINPARTATEHGREGATRFWETYLSAFDGIASKFENVLEGDGFAVLEWRSDGKLAAGDELSYRGVSILNFSGDKVSRFVTYYDSAAFLPEGSKHSAGA